MNRKIRAAIALLAAAFTVAVAIAPVASAARVLLPTGLGEIATVAPTHGGTSAQRLGTKEKESDDSSTEKKSLRAARSNSA